MGRKRSARGQRVAAKKKRRDQRTKKAAPPSRKSSPVRLTVPIWEYPSAAQILTEALPEMSFDDALDYMLTEPVLWQNEEGRINSFAPADYLAESGETAATLVRSLEIMHESGLLAWDAEHHIHVQKFPTNAPQPLE